MPWKNGQRIIYGGKPGKIKAVKGDRVDIEMDHGGKSTNVPITLIRKA